MKCLVHVLVEHVDVELAATSTDRCGVVAGFHGAFPQLLLSVVVFVVPVVGLAAPFLAGTHTHAHRGGVVEFKGSRTHSHAS